MTDTYTLYKHINYTLAPSGLYVGWVFYDNGIYYASHRTVEKCVNGVKHQLYLAKKVSMRGYTVATKPTPKEDVPIERMKQAFLTRAYWGRKRTDKLTAEQQEVHKRTFRMPSADMAVPATVTPEYDYYDYKIEDGKLVVFGCKKVAEYNIQTVDLPAEFKKGVDPEKRETLHLPLGE